jgi:protein SCO1/2
MLSTRFGEYTRRREAPLRSALVFGALLFLAGVMLIAVAFRGRTGPWVEEPLPELWPAPALSLVDQHGRTFGSPDFDGRAAIFSFVYTNCTDMCPLLTANMAQVQSKLRAEGLLGSKVQLVSITVDPHRDSPEVLAAYAERFRAEADAWRFLSGDPESVYQVLWGFKLNTLEVARAFAGADVIPHSNRLAVVDPRGTVRAQLDGTEVSPNEIVSVVRRVLP